MTKLKDLSFRNFYKKLLFIEDINNLNVLNKGYGIDIDGDENGLLVYGYIDSEHGICFNIFSIVKEEDGQIIKFNDKPVEAKINHRIRLSDVQELRGFEVELDPNILERYVARAIELNEKFFESDTKDALRYNMQIDQYRHLIFPDDLECFIYDKNENKLEGFWMRGKMITQDGIIGEIITPLSRTFGYGIGDEIKVNLYSVNEHIRLMHVVQ